MRIYVVDSNIIFSTAFNPKGLINQSYTKVIDFNKIKEIFNL